MTKPISLALTYDDVLIRPRRSSLTSRQEANTKTRLTKKISVNIPLVTANMDMVTGEDMAIIMARLGGIGILHRFLTIEENVAMVKKVKRAQNLIINDPYTVLSTATIAEVRKKIAEKGVSGMIVTTPENKLLGVISGRDLLFAKTEDITVAEIMTPREKLLTAEKGVSFDEAASAMAKAKIEKLPVVDSHDCVVGLVNMTDIQLHKNYPLANLDKDGQLIVGAAVGVHGDYLERAQELVKAGVDVLVIDIAHGHSDLMFQALKKIRDACGNVQIIAGNIATGDAARELCEAGVDAIKIGVGPGATCITRLITGCGMPQLTAVLECAEVAATFGVPVVADGGIQKSGDIVKAIGAGADTVMIGSLFAGTTESPGRIVARDGKKYKIYRGSASFAVSERRKMIGLEKRNLDEVVPEGVESVVPFRGTVVESVGQLIGGLKSGMSYTNSHTILELQKNVEFVQITNAGFKESGPHDIGEK